MTEQKARRLAKKRLSEKRYQHTLNVRRMAVKLAKRWGADPEKAALAALLHDTAKELPREEMLQILNDNAIMAENAQNRPSPVWHGICAAILAQTQWGVEMNLHWLEESGKPVDEETRAALEDLRQRERNVAHE